MIRRRKIEEKRLVKQSKSSHELQVVIELHYEPEGSASDVRLSGTIGLFLDSQALDVASIGEIDLPNLKQGLTELEHLVQKEQGYQGKISDRTDPVKLWAVSFTQKDPGFDPFTFTDRIEAFLTHAFSKDEVSSRHQRIGRNSYYNTIYVQGLRDVESV